MDDLSTNVITILAEQKAGSAKPAKIAADEGIEKTLVNQAYKKGFLTVARVTFGVVFCKVVKNFSKNNNPSLRR